MDVREANELIGRLERATRRLVEERTLFESSLFPIYEYMALGLYNFYEKSYDTFKEIVKHKAPEEIGALGKTICSEVNQKAQFAIIVGYLTGREQVIADGEIDEFGGLGEDAERTLFMLDFWKRSTSSYREDGGLLVYEQGGTIPALRRNDVESLSEQLVRPTEEQLSSVRRMWAQLRSYLYLLNCESRGGMFNHGPYGLESGEVLVVSELIHFWKSFERAKEVLPYSNLALVMRLRNVKVSFDDVGTMIIEPSDYSKNVVALNLFTREGRKVKRVELSEAEEIGRAAAGLKNELFEVMVKWSKEEKLIAGALQYSDFTSYLEVLDIMKGYKHELSERCYKKYLPRVMEMGMHPILRRFKTGERLFTPVNP